MTAALQATAERLFSTSPELNALIDSLARTDGSDVGLPPFIALRDNDSSLAHAAANAALTPALQTAVFQTCFHLRQARRGMVQNATQYAFVSRLVAVAAQCIDSFAISLRDRCNDDQCVDSVEVSENIFSTPVASQPNSVAAVQQSLSVSFFSSVK